MKVRNYSLTHYYYSVHINTVHVSESTKTGSGGKTRRKQSAVKDTAAAKASCPAVKSTSDDVTDDPLVSLRMMARQFGVPSLVKR